MFHALADVLPDAAVFTVDAERNITFWSAGAERLLGYRADQVTGAYCLKSNRCMSCLARCGLSEKGDIAGTRLVLIAADGGKVAVRKYARALRGPGGEFLGGVEVLVPDRAEAAVAAPPVDPPGAQRFHGLVSADPGMHRVFDIVRNVADSDATVLVRGESGTGKDLLAQIIHLMSPAHNEPFLKIDCASLPPDLVESELFGHERGAFTGADAQKRGRLEMAGAGTIVLDEVAALGFGAQAKLLRVIEEKKFQRLGGNDTIRIAARLIALTNADLEKAVAQRMFREDLYYRLNVFPIVIPPLRNRRADIVPLAERLLQQLCDLHHRPPARLSARAAAVLAAYDFPGNGRELKNMLERGVIYSGAEEIRVEDLPAHLENGALQRQRNMMTLEDMEREYIAEVLDHTRGRKTEAAEILGISRKTLLEKRKRYKLD